MFDADNPNREKNAQAFAQLSLLLDPRSLSLVMRDARDDGKKAMEILRSHYQSSGKPRIITLYTELTSLKKGSDETITDYVLRAETASTMLKSAGEEVSDSLLVAMVLKGLPAEYQPFVAIVTQSEEDYAFAKFKASLRSFEETEKHRMSYVDGDDKIMKIASDGKGKIVCFNCGKEGHKTPQCKKKKKNSGGKNAGGNTGGPWCGSCKSSSHNQSECRHQQKKLADGNNKHSYQFMLMFSPDEDGEDYDDDEDDAHPSAHCDVVDLPPEDVEPSVTGAKSDNHDKINSNHHILDSDELELLVDSGSTSHVVNRDILMKTDEDFKPSEHCVELADGTKTWGEAKKRGDVLLKLRNSDGDVVDVTLNNVLYISTMCILCEGSCSQIQRRCHLLTRAVCYPYSRW